MSVSENRLEDEVAETGVTPYKRIADGTIAMVHVSTTDQRADILTKVVDSAVFHRHVASLMSDVP
jgi:hypothetical protein